MKFECLCVRVCVCCEIKKEGKGWRLEEVEGGWVCMGKDMWYHS